MKKNGSIGRFHSSGERSGFLRKFLAMLICVAAAVFAVALFFKVETFVVNCDGEYSDEEVIEASGIRIGDNMILLNKAGAAGRMMQRLPYAREVVIRRILPETVELTVVLTEPAAVIESETEELWRIDAEGILLEQIEEDEIGDLLLVTGSGLLISEAGSRLAAPEGEEERLDALLTILSVLSETDLLVAPTELNLEKIYSITLRCSDRYEVELGGTEDLAYKLRYLEAVMLQLPDGQDGVIDLQFNEEKTAHFLPYS